jgi:hypothetical protein
MSEKQRERVWDWILRSIMIAGVVISIDMAIRAKFDAATYLLL